MAALGGGVVHKIEQQLATEEVNGEIRDIPLEHGRKNHAHHRHNHQRAENAPKIPQPTPPVLKLDVLNNKQPKEVPVLPEFTEKGC